MRGLFCLPLLKRSTGMNQQHDSLFFRLPPELRLEIYEDVLGATRARPLYFQRHVWSWTQHCLKQTKSRNCHRLLVTCHRMKLEVLEILYKRHELQFYTATTTSLLHQEKVRKRICKLEEYEEVLQRVRRVRIVLFIPREPCEERTLLALIAYLKVVLAERHEPLEKFTLEMCAIDATSCKPTAILYAAQGFRSIVNTQFEFQSGFSGVGSESAKEVLVQSEAKKDTSRGLDMPKEKALQELEQAWSKTQPGWYNPRLLSNSWLGTTLEV
ncbi:hypothetical protein CERZMDRAFT_97640 [Cercospora zeae-maydis SCOH1-5]|uniref:F-box domain-containing protein n=1 Tax=Cercospora zeae-maydis SCOH1-5 TaxID=717836 RepID=A0A6A6FGC3_9PEZI|nr:hypothetical protein CERZMDRAFT_97640 [Cercospora zeae-maydis SCOH1-5]